MRTRNTGISALMMARLAGGCKVRKRVLSPVDASRDSIESRREALDIEI